MARLRKLSRSSHRWLGIIVALPLLVASITGVILNHTVDFQLSEKRVSSPWILSHYGMELTGEPTAYGTSGTALAGQWEGQIFFQNATITSANPLIAAVPLRDGTTIVTTEEVHYYGLDGELIETLDSSSLPPGPFTSAGHTDDFELVLISSEKQWKSDADLLEFTELGETPIAQLSVQVPVTEADRSQWRRSFLGGGIPLDRVILDLHSGRIFGTLGKWVWDILVLFILILSASGFVLFFKNRNRAK